MQPYKQQFIEFMVRSGVLTFGDFTTKSGRRTPFFINTGNYRTGRQLARLGAFYATALHERLGTDFDVLFGPAYKGIPLATLTAAALAEQFDHDVRYCFNRKEKKDHGEGGSLVGHVPAAGERVVIVEDVTTAGTSVRESTALLRAVADVRFAGLIVSVDRMERGTGKLSALEQIRQDFSMPTEAIVTLDEIVSHLHNRPVDGETILDDTMKEKIDAYRAAYGASRS